jgi:radical SAM protein with 4Fe4S-binding SPASM domain
LYNSFNDIGLSINIAYNEDWNDISLLKLEEQIFRLSNIYCDIILNNDINFSLRLFDDNIRDNIFERPGKGIVCGGGRNVFSVSPDGIIFVCGNFIGCGINNEFVTIGNVNEGIQYNLVKQYINTLENINKKSCKGCLFEKRCYTYCTFANYMSSGSIYDISKNLCEINKVININSDKIFDTLYKKNQSIIERRFLKEC